jgi:predicted O-methyltransferase YrrM
VRAIAEAIIARVEGHSHDEQVNSSRALGPLQFPRSETLTALVRDTYPSPDAVSSRGQAGNPYPLLPDTLHFLSALLDRTSPEVVLEFGSGESTRMFATWAAKHGARLVSVEHDRRWVDEIAQQLSPVQREAVKMVHAPLRQIRRGLRQFFAYGFLDQLALDVERARLVLVDGPYISGRELVLYFVLSHSRPGALIVVDDFRHYSVREMLLGIPKPLASCFAGEPIHENSHGLYVLQCLKQPPKAKIPNLGVRPILRSYWRSLRDSRRYGTGD